MTDGGLKIHSDKAWEIALKYSYTLSSDTRTLAAHIDVALSEARATGYREAYEVRMKKFRSGCACHMNDSDEIVSMCQHHESLVAEARATGRRYGLSEAAEIAEEPITYTFPDGSPAVTRPRPDGATIAAAIRAAMEKAE